MKGFLKSIGILLVIIAGLIGGAYYYFEHHMWSQLHSDGFEDENAKAEQDALNKLIAEQNGYGDDRPLVFLIAGIDTNDVSVGRSDSLVLAIVDTKSKKVNMLSVPRDLRVEIPNRGTDKINAAYAYGGISLAKSTVSTYLDVPIDQYFVINFDGFKQLIDTIGGIEIDVEKDIKFHDRISNKHFALSKGVQTLNGEQALNYARFRKDAEGDFGRMRRQQQVISEMIKQTATIGNVTKINSIFSALGNNMRTDVQFDDASKLAVSFVGSSGSNIEGLKINAYPAMINGVSYVVMDDAEHERIKEEIKQILKREK